MTSHSIPSSEHARRTGSRAVRVLPPLWSPGRFRLGTVYFVDATIYHNPKCSTSRKALQALRDAGIEPAVVKYLDEPYTREQLVALFADAGVTPPAQAVRKRETLYKELDLASATDDQILDAMVEHPPILVERPIVVTDKGTRIPPRPIEKLDEIL